MTISATNFPIWFFTGFYGGLVCCVLAILISLRALYTNVRRRGVTRRLVGVVVACMASFLCLLPIFFLFRMHFNVPISLIEVSVLFYSVILFGWLFPISLTIFSFVWYYSDIFAVRRSDVEPQRALAGLFPPRYESGILAPFVFSADNPWGWLEYRSGNFRGQRLALKRSIITLGRSEDSDIWLDDDMASRRHAELAWVDGIVYLTDCDSLNSTRLNGRRVRGSVLLSSDDIIEIGSHRFLFSLAEQKISTIDQDDPLENHTWRSAFELQDSRETTQFSFPLPAIKPLLDSNQISMQSQAVEAERVTSGLYTPAPLLTPRGMLLARNGEFAGKRFFLQSLSVTVGSGVDCDLVVRDLELAPLHARFIREAQGDYVQDLSSLGGQEGTFINGEPVQGMQLLQPGDRVRFGSFHLTYLSALQGAEAQVPSSQERVPVNAPLSNGPISNGPMPLRLPSRPKG